MKTVQYIKSRIWKKKEGKYYHLRSTLEANLVPRASATLVQRNGKTETSGIDRLSSAFHWPLIERAQFPRKLINNNFVPRFPIPSRAPRMCKLWVRSLPAGTWRTKHRESLGFDIQINSIFEDAVILGSSAIVIICLELI